MNGQVYREFAIVDAFIFFKILQVNKILTPSIQYAVCTQGRVSKVVADHDDLLTH